MSSAPDDFGSLPPIYIFDEITSNSYHLDSIGIPNTILQMAFNKIFIPFSMLMASTMDHVRYNHNLKYHKIIFSNGASKYSPDE